MSFVIIHHPNVHSTSFLCSFSTIVWEDQFLKTVFSGSGKHNGINWSSLTHGFVRRQICFEPLETCQLELSVVEMRIDICCEISLCLLCFVESHYCIYLSPLQSVIISTDKFQSSIPSLCPLPALSPRVVHVVTQHTWCMGPGVISTSGSSDPPWVMWVIITPATTRSF